MWWCICCRFSARLFTQPGPPWPPKACWSIYTGGTLLQNLFHDIISLLVLFFCCRCVFDRSSQIHDDDDDDEDDDVWGSSHMGGCNVHLHNPPNLLLPDSPLILVSFFPLNNQWITPLLKSGSNLNVSPDWVNQVVLMHVHCSNTADGSFAWWCVKVFLWRLTRGLLLRKPTHELVPWCCSRNCLRNSKEIDRNWRTQVISKFVRTKPPCGECCVGMYVHPSQFLQLTFWPSG
jgi:hypothetical protein